MVHRSNWRFPRVGVPAKILNWILVGCRRSFLSPKGERMKVRGKYVKAPLFPAVGEGGG